MRLHYFFDLFPPPIAARRAMGGMYAERCTLIPIAEILYAFSGSATALGLIDASWIGSHDFRHGHIYIRTHDGIFFIHHRSLAELMERLEPYRFLSLSHSVFVNLHKVTLLDLDGKLKRVGLMVSSETEWLVVNRRYISDLRKILVLPRRR